jgi:transcriptional regulator with GAF, ATPase, and Fis domain
VNADTAEVIERAVILCRGDLLQIDPKLPVSPDDRPMEMATASLEDVERNHLLAVLGQTDWRIEGSRNAAQILGLHPNTLRSRIKKLGINRRP